MKTIAYNAHHSPIGAFASFTLGLPGAKGGFGLELGKPADENVFIGAESRQKGLYDCLPFFEGADDEAKRYTAEAIGRGAATLRPIPLSKIRRDYRVATDTWTAGDLTFRLVSPVMPVPDPGKASKRDLQFAVCPAVLATLTLDNRKGKRSRDVFFGWQGSDPYSSMRHLSFPAGSGLIGVGQGTRTALISADAVVAGQSFDMESVLQTPIPENRKFGLGGIAGLVGTVPAGEQQTFTFALCFYRGGIVTAGMPCSYWYTRYWKDIEAVGAYALSHAEDYLKAAEQADAEIRGGRLSPEQQFQLTHAIRSYYGSTEFLEHKGAPFWVVNEGEYRMMNTFDLTVDQLFYEMRMNPWTVRNELDMFTERYSYSDQVHAPGGANDLPGGISFTHDMGIANSLSRAQYSSYEQFGLKGCFSHMTHEQLVNWILCATVYCRRTRDTAWLQKRLPIFRKCLRSMLNRDHPDDAQRNGVMGLDSSRTLDGSEITTYDSLDESLGQSRNNVYLAVKSWAAYVALERLFTEAGCRREAGLSGRQAGRNAATICGQVDAQGRLPALLFEGSDSHIIPAIEGLVFPYVLGLHDALAYDGPYGALMQTLRTHLEAILKPGICLYESGGWKLSSTADNSWLSKIYLCQFVARRVLGLKQSAAMKQADRVHVEWLTGPKTAYYAWSDQMVSGAARGSKYYPRGVTAILWLDE